MADDGHGIATGDPATPFRPVATLADMESLPVFRAIRSQLNDQEAFGLHCGRVGQSPFMATFGEHMAAAADPTSTAGARAAADIYVAVVGLHLLVWLRHVHVRALMAKGELHNAQLTVSVLERWVRSAMHAWVARGFQLGDKGAPILPLTPVMTRRIDGFDVAVTQTDLHDVKSAVRCITGKTLDLYIDNAVIQHITNTWETAAARAGQGSAEALLGPQLSAAGASAPGRAHCWSTNVAVAITNGTYDNARKYHHLSRCSATYSKVRWWLVPILVPATHWALAVADPGRATIHYYDPWKRGALVDDNGSNNHLAAPDHRLRLIARWCERATADPMSWAGGGTPVPADTVPQQEWQIVRHAAPQQTDYSSCGAYVAAYAGSIMAGTAWTPTNGQAACARKAMYEALTAPDVIDLADQTAPNQPPFPHNTAPPAPTHVMP
jgi:hypothetical protein